MNTTVLDELELGIRRVVALQLWQLGAIRVNLAEPFRLASGNYSPIYINCRQLISAPAFADLFAAGARIICGRHAVRFDVIAGGETAGIPFAAFLARSFGCPMAYVRKETKSHGIASRIEGMMEAGSRVLLVEDLITDAGSKLSFIDAVSESGSTVQNVLVAFDRLQGGREALDKLGIALHAITDIDVALAVAEDSELLASEALGEIRQYLDDAEAWHAARGLAYRQA